MCFFPPSLLSLHLFLNQKIPNNHPVFLFLLLPSKTAHLLPVLGQYLRSGEGAAGLHRVQRVRPSVRPRELQCGHRVDWAATGRVGHPRGRPARRKGRITVVGGAGENILRAPPVHAVCPGRGQRVVQYPKWVCRRYWLRM